MLLSKPHTDLSSDAQCMPYILHKLDRDGTLLKGPPGLEVIITVQDKAVWSSTNLQREREREREREKERERGRERSKTKLKRITK